MWLFASTIFLSAFLLFQVQPLIARVILPWFGGTASVWSVCLMFFQIELLLGYLYAHGSIAKLAPRRQAILHILLLGASLLTLPILPEEGWKPRGTENPTLWIVLVLLTSVGLPYLLLSTTSPLLQAWYSGSGSAGDEKAPFPYRLYALSNAGSLLGLLTYPVLFEPMMAIREQALAWSAVYAVFALLAGAIAWRTARAASPVTTGASADVVDLKTAAKHGSDPDAPGAGRILLWLALSSCSCILLLAVTNRLTQDIAPVPFLWVGPLALYLLSFIVCFGAREWQWPSYLLILPPIAFLAMGLSLLQYFQTIAIRYLILQLLACLFVLFLVCHGELARRKPHPRHLTLYYLVISVGGALGGIFVGLVAPVVFHNYYELPLGIIACAVLTWALLYRPASLRLSSTRDRFASTAAVLAGMLLGLSAPLLYNLGEHFWGAFGGFLWLLLGIAGCVTIAWGPFAKDRAKALWSLRSALSLSFLCAVVSLVVWIYMTEQSPRDYRLLARNFYGVVRETDTIGEGPESSYRTLIHGTIQHGIQILEPQYRMEPTTYYGYYSGIGALLDGARLPPNLHVGVIGLGTGTIAAYGRPGDRYRFYEINPLVIRLARTDFTFLSGSAAKTETVLGDARLSLEREPDQQFDVLAVDAFSGDAIPIHLLTIEAFRLYDRHLKPNGVLAMHITNTFLDLKPVVAAAAAELKMDARMIVNAERKQLGILDATWVLLTRDRSLFDQPIMKQAGRPIPVTTGFRLWTDDYSNVIGIWSKEE